MPLSSWLARIVVSDIADWASSGTDEAVPLSSIAEFVAGYEVSSWYGIGAPRNTPSDVIDTLNKAVNVGLADPRLKKQLDDQGGIEMAGTPADFGKLIADETEKWGKVVKFAGIKAD
jgi:tripartite-type tricarboxylate transporter receptor subunit TctC